jgi:hypothetical protein
MTLRRTQEITAPLYIAWMYRGALIAIGLVLVALVAPCAALARGGDDVRVAGSCGRGASAELRLKEDHGAIEVELRVRRGHSGERWSVTLVHERRVAWGGRATPRNDGFRVRRTLPDFAGADEVTARAANARGLTCQATGTLRS